MVVHSFFTLKTRTWGVLLEESLLGVNLQEWEFQGSRFVAFLSLTSHFPSKQEPLTPCKGKKGLACTNRSCPRVLVLDLRHSVLVQKPNGVIHLWGQMNSDQILSLRNLRTLWEVEDFT